MAKVHYRKAAKDYAQAGISKGDMYFYVQMKTGPRSSRVMRSLTRFKPSQLTTSAFKIAWLSAGEEWTAGDRDGDAARTLAENLREAGQEAQDSFDNMPEGLQEGDTGQLLYARAEGAENAGDAIEELAGELDDAANDMADAQNDYDEADIILADDDENEEAQAEADDAEERVSAASDEIESARDQITELADDMPEY